MPKPRTSSTCPSNCNKDLHWTDGPCSFLSLAQHHNHLAPTPHTQPQQAPGAYSGHPCAPGGSASLLRPAPALVARAVDGAGGRATRWADAGDVGLAAGFTVAFAPRNKPPRSKGGEAYRQPLPPGEACGKAIKGSAPTEPEHRSHRVEQGGRPRARAEARPARLHTHTTTTTTTTRLAKPPTSGAGRRCQSFSCGRNRSEQVRGLPLPLARGRYVAGHPVAAARRRRHPSAAT